MKHIYESKLSLNQRKVFTIIIIVLVILFSFLVAVIAGKPMIEFVNKPDQFRDFVDSYGVLSDIIFILMIVLQTIIAIIPGEPFEIAAGYAFGYIRGTIDCLIGFAIGGTVVFILVKKYGARILEIFFPVEKIKSLKFLQNTKRLNTLTFIVFLIPGTPKDLITYFIGLTDMKLSIWIFITTVARIPSLISSVLGGSALGNKRYEIAVLVLVVTLIISGIGILIYKKIKERN